VGLDVHEAAEAASEIGALVALAATEHGRVGREVGELHPPRRFPAGQQATGAAGEPGEGADAVGPPVRTNLKATLARPPSVDPGAANANPGCLFDERGGLGRHSLEQHGRGRGLAQGGRGAQAQHTVDRHGELDRDLRARRQGDPEPTVAGDSRGAIGIDRDVVVEQR
jgi:hypothetical protein